MEEKSGLVTKVVQTRLLPGGDVQRLTEPTDKKAVGQSYWGHGHAALIADFYRQMYGCEISDEELDIMRQIAKEAGVIDETD